MRWTLVTDRPYNIKCLGMYVGMMCIIYQMVNLMYAVGNIQQSYELIRYANIVMPLSIMGAGGSYFFISYSYWKDGIRELTMLPASKAEKFTVRFLLPMLLQFVYLAVGCLVADFLQHLVGFIINREPLEWMLADTFQFISLKDLSGKALLSLSMILFWTNSMFLLGANLFRNIKYNFLITSVVLLVLFIAIMALLPSDFKQKGMIFRQILDYKGIITTIILLSLSVFNIWLSYRLFGYRPLIGKFINKL